MTWHPGDECHRCGKTGDDVIKRQIQSGEHLLCQDCADVRRGKGKQAHGGEPPSGPPEIPKEVSSDG